MASKEPFKNAEIPNSSDNALLSSLTGDEVVISGISGMFPKSNSVNEFMENLYNKVDMVIAVDPKSKLSEMPRHQGVVEGLDKFDAPFFRVTFNQAKSLDPMIRKLMEHAYSAIYDSGYNPLDYYGKKLGVFVGSQYMDTIDICLYENSNANGFFVSGCSKTMMPNRISYWFNGNAPSYSADFSCTGSLACLEHAYHCIKSGQCDSAIVGCSNICLLPGLFVNLTRAGMLCLDGKTKCFDRNGDGFVRSDSVNVIFLQRARDARRIYSEIYYAKTKYGLKQGDNLLPHRKTEDMTQFFEDFYTKIGVSPEEVEYVEAHATAIADADANEMEAIGNFFGKKSPVKIGSVKSNMGNSEAAAGLCAITKACLAYHTGKLPGNLHYKEPLDISSIREERLKVVQDNVPFERGLVGVNSFSYTGLDAHVLLKGHYKPKDKKRYSSDIPYLVTISARQEEGVDKILSKLEAQPLDPEFIALLQKIHEKSTVNHMGRGYVLLDWNEKQETISLARSVTYYSGEAKPVCFIYSGMGSQWAGMGAKLMQIPIFSNAIKKCDKVLRPKGIDVVEIISSTDKTMFDNILNSFIGITAIQIGLTDILKELGIEPDLLIGHSLGEMGCAYADGCFTTEEAILTSYSRGLASIETKFIPGAMAAIGLGYKDIVKLVPPEIDIACHNSSESSTISGPAEAVAQFVKLLKNNGVFAKEVQSSGISYHSRYTAVAGPKLYSGLKSIIINPKPRSEKWLCTSMPREKWNSPLAKFSSAEYHVNNLLSPVYFEETCSLIPPSAVIIEIAPHGLMQAILKRSHTDCANIALTKRGESDSVKFLLQAIGKLYENGLDPKISKLYPDVDFPVSTETPLLSHLVEWDHGESWPVVQSTAKKLVTTASREFVMSIYDDDYRFIEGYIRNGFNVLPESFLLLLTWETLAMSIGINYRRLPVKFRNIKFHDELIINSEAAIKLSININKNENRFEVCNEEKLFVTGFISYNKKLDRGTKKYYDFKNELKIESQDIYKMMYQRGYSYKDEFQSLFSVDINCEEGAVKWTENWTTFIDGLLQLNMLANKTKALLKPKLIQELEIDVYEHKVSELKTSGNYAYLNAEVATNTNSVTKCGGVKLVNVIFQTTPLPKRDPDVFHKKEFCSFFSSGNYDLYTGIYILLQVITENLPKENLNVTEFIPTADNKSVMHIVKDIANHIEVIVKLHTQITDKTQKVVNILDNDKTYKKQNVLIIHDLARDKEEMIEIHNNLHSNVFVLAIEKESNIKIMLQSKCFIVISVTHISENKVLMLMKKRYDFATYGGVKYIKIDNYYQFSWVNQVLTDLASNKRVILISENQHYNGAIGIVKYISKNYGNRLSLIQINDKNAPIFDPETAIYKEQLQKELIINILQKGLWGGFYSIPNKPYATTENYALTIDIPSDFNSFKWFQSPSTKISPRTVKVYYAGISLKDVDKAMGINKVNDLTFGMDFSGTDIYGNRVMGLIPEGAIANTINADSDLLWPVPNHWTLKEAATVPLAYVHAYYCLSVRSVLYKGVSVIVTGAAGALGQAVISICLAHGHNVYALVSNNEKKKLLLKLYPELKENQIYNSRDKHSVAMILSDSVNKRRSMVINCDSGNLRQELMACVGAMGYFLDISKKDLKENETLGMGYLDWDKNYVAVDLSNLFNPENVLQRKKLQYIVAEGIARGIVKPLNCVEYYPAEISRAFNLISSRKHRGKAIINLKETINDSLKLSPRIKCSSDNSFLVICDNNELGLEVVDLLVHRAAKNIVLHLKKAKLSGYGESKLASWRNKNVNVISVSDNIETEEGCSNIYNEAVKIGPVEGIFMILDNIDDHNYKDIIENQDYANKFNGVSSGLINLETISRNSVQNTLRYFAILTQSPQSIFDEYINSVSEEICRARNEVGLPGLVFQAKHITKLSSPLEITNTVMGPQDLSTFCNGLETSLQLKYNNIQIFNLEEQLKDLDKKDSGLPDSAKLNGHNYESDEEINKINIIEKFKKSKQDNPRSKNNFNGGLGAFFTFIDNDLYRATDPFVPMATKVVNTFLEKDEVDPTATYLMLIPGFEGHSKIFEMLCLRLKTKAFTIQLCPDMKNNSIREMAANIFKLLKKRLALQEKFYLLGYSFGVNIALELTSMLEKEGHVGVVYCLDSSPDILRTQLESYIGNQSDKQLQDSIIEHMFKLVKGENTSDISDDLRTLNDWNEKTEFLVKLVKDFNNYSHQYIKILLDSAYRRILLARNYNPTFNLNSQLVLIRGNPHPNSEPLPQDYNLSKYSKHSVKVFEIESDTALAAYDFQVPNILNKMLDPELLEKFNNTSSCEVYFIESKGFDF